MYRFYSIKSSSDCQSLEQLSGNIWNVQERFSFLSSNNKFYCPYFLSLPLDSSFWFTPGDRDGGRKLASRFGSGQDRESHPGTWSSYLGLGHNGILSRGGTEEGGQWGGNDDRIRPDKAAEVTAGDGVLLCLHHQSVHGIEAIPWQPHGALLAHERGPLEVQGQGGATIGDQVEPGEGQVGSLRAAKLTCRLGGALTSMLRAVDGQSGQEETAGFVGRRAGWEPKLYHLLVV